MKLKEFAAKVYSDKFPKTIRQDIYDAYISGFDGVEGLADDYIVQIQEMIGNLYDLSFKKDLKPEYIAKWREKFTQKNEV